jgi:perosamine synthetase
MIPLSMPFINGNESKYVKNCLDTGWISSAGSYVEMFEEKVASYVGTKYAVACMNGTVGLQISLIVSGIQKSDYVLVPNLTFVASLNAIKHTGADPILIDVDQSNWQIDLNVLENFLKTKTSLKIINKTKFCVLDEDGRIIKCVMPVHVLGNMCDMEHLKSIAKKYSLLIIEDSTEALGSFFNQRHAGTFGNLGVFSFNGNKIISTGGGGLIITNDYELAKNAKHLTTQAKISKMEYIHDEVGYNYRLVNILAAVGVAQMEQLSNILVRKKKIDSFYKKKLNGLGDINFQSISSNVNNNCWLFTFRTNKMRSLLKHLNDNGIESRPFWMPMNQLQMFKNCIYVNKSDTSGSLYETCISIPCSAGISIEQMELVYNQINNFYK